MLFLNQGVVWDTCNSHVIAGYRSSLANVLNYQPLQSLLFHIKWSILFGPSEGLRFELLRVCLLLNRSFSFSLVLRSLVVHGVQGLVFCFACPHDRSQDVSEEESKSREFLWYLLSRPSFSEGQPGFAGEVNGSASRRASLWGSGWGCSTSRLRFLSAEVDKWLFLPFLALLSLGFFFF